LAVTSLSFRIRGTLGQVKSLKGREGWWLGGGGVQEDTVEGSVCVAGYEAHWGI
jgi:hypothetical protein